MSGGGTEPEKMKRTYFVRAVWDPEAEVWFSESDIDGLNIEAKTVEEFEAVMKDVAAELVVANHIAGRLATTPLKDLVPAILWQRPEPRDACV